MQESTQNLAQRALRQVQAEPVKAGMLAVLLLVMGTLWIKAASSGATSPAAASARSTPALSDVAGAVADNHAARSIRQLAEWVRRPMPAAGRNLFAMKLDYFPTDGSRPAEKPRAGSSFWDELGKSLATKADQEKARRILIDNLRLQASQLELQTTVMKSGSPQALVNGTLVGEGDTVAGFKIVRIEAQRLVVEKQGVRLEVAFNFRK